MKYMIMTPASQADFGEMAGRSGVAWTDEDRAAYVRFMAEFNRTITKSGELVETRGLAMPVHSRRLRLVDGVPEIIYGQYDEDENEKLLAGYWIVECSGYERVTGLAAMLLAAPGPNGTRATSWVDIRPVIESMADLESTGDPNDD